MSTADTTPAKLAALEGITRGLDMLLDVAEYFRAGTPEGARAFQRCVDAVLKHIAREQPAPEPAPAPALAPERHSWLDEPPDFQHEVPIGEILGSTVYAARLWDPEISAAVPYATRATLNGLTISAYPPCLGDEREYINVNTGDGLDSVGDLWWSEVQRLVELAQMPGDPLGQLMAMARAFVAETPAAE